MLRFDCSNLGIFPQPPMVINHFAAAKNNDAELHKSASDSWAVPKGGVVR